MNDTTTTIIATDAQATDEAVLMLTRRLHRLYPDAYKAVITSLSDGLRDALNLADNRADSLRHTDKREGVTRKFETLAERIEREMEIEDEDADEEDTEQDEN